MVNGGFLRKIFSNNSLTEINMRVSEHRSIRNSLIASMTQFGRGLGLKFFALFASLGVIGIVFIEEHSF